MTEPMLEPNDTTPKTPRKRARKAPAADPSVALATDSDVAVADPVLGAAVAGAAAKKPAKKAAKKVAKKAAVAQPPLDLETSGTPETVETSGASDADGGAPAAKKAPRKRAAKKVAAPPAEEPPADAPTTTEAVVSPAEPGTEVAPDDERTAVTAPAAPSVLFLPPTDTAPKRRRARKATAPAGEPPATGPDTGTPAAAPSPAGPPAGDTTIAAHETDETDESDESDETGDGADPDEIREAAIEQASGARRRRRRGRRGRGGRTAANGENDDSSDNTDDSPDDGVDGTHDSATDTTTGDTADDASDDAAADDADDSSPASRRRRRRRRSGGSSEDGGPDDPPNTVTHVREPRKKGDDGDDGVRGVRGSTRLEAKRQRRRDGRETTRRRAPILTEAEFLARREAVDRVMAVRQNGDRTQIAVLEDNVLVEHYVTRASATSYVGNVYLGRVQNVLPSMEAAFIDIGKGRNGVLYAGEVNWDAAGLEGKSRAIEQALKSGDSVLVQVTKDPIGHKGARLTSQVSLPGRFLVYVPGGGMTGISRRLPDTERHRLKAILKKIVPEDAGVIVRTAAEGASEEDLTHDVQRLQAQWETIAKAAGKTKSAPTLVHGEPDLATRVVRDVFNEDFRSLVVQGEDVWRTVSDYVGSVAPDLAERTSRHTGTGDLFHDLRVDEQLMKALDRKVWLPSGGSLVIDRTEAMTVIDVNTGKFIGSGGNLEQTVTRNNLEAAEEVVRQLRLRDVGGIVVIDFIDMVLESNRDLVLRRLTECLGRDRTKHQVAEVTSLGLVQMTRKRVGEGLLEAFSEPCEVCHGRGVIVHGEPVEHTSSGAAEEAEPKGRRRRGGKAKADPEPEPPVSVERRQAASAAIAAIHRAASGAETDDASIMDELATGLVEAARRSTGARTPDDVPAHDVPAADVPEADAPEADAPEADAPEADVPEADASEADASAAVGPAVEPAEPAAAPAHGPDTTQSDATAAAMAAVVSSEAPADTAGPSTNGAAPRRRRRAASRPAGPPVTPG